MSKPVFVLLHGAWHSPQCWDLLTAELDRAGYRSVTPRLPSSADHDGDIETIRKAVSDLVQEDDVVVVIHSYSFTGKTGGSSLEGLDKQTCVSKGLRGGVIRLVYIVAFLMPEGVRHSPRGWREMILDMRRDPETNNLMPVLPEDGKGMFYQYGHDKTVAERSTTTHAAWRDILTTYVLCLGDGLTTVAEARFPVEAERASGRHKIDNVIEVEAGHSPFVTIPRWTAEMLIIESGRRA